MTPRIDLAQSNDSFLRSGWSPPKTLWDNTPVRWVLGKEAAVSITRTDAEPTAIRIRLKSPRNLPAGQELRVLVNGNALGAGDVTTRLTTLQFQAPASIWRPGSNALILQFKRTIEPSDGVWSPRAAAVEWIEFSPSDY